MAIQVRRGLKKDFDPYKMLPGEWAVSIDNQTQNQIVWMCFAAGVVKRMGTYEDFKAQIEEATGEILQQFITQLTEAAQELQNNVEIYIQGKVDNEWTPALQALVEKSETSEKAAADSASAAKQSEDNSRKSEESASGSAETATQKADEAFQSASVASQEAQTATEKAQEAEYYSKLSESWSHGNTGVRSGEDTNNSEYFSSLADKLVQEAQKLLEQAQKIVAAATQGALIPAGTIAFDELPMSPEVGYMYNISDDFTTDSRFEEGTGVFYRSGANVYWTKDGKWDVMIGAQVTGIKGDAEDTYHIGNYNITPKKIGAQPTITGAATSITGINLVADMALISDKNGKVATHGSVSATELGYLEGVTSYIQTQFNLLNSNLNNFFVANVGSIDLNTIDSTSFVLFNADSNNNPLTLGNGICLTFTYDISRAAQIVLGVSAKSEVWYRRKNIEKWDNWMKLSN